MTKNVVMLKIKEKEVVTIGGQRYRPEYSVQIPAVLEPAPVRESPDCVVQEPAPRTQEGRQLQFAPHRPTLGRVVPRPRPLSLNEFSHSTIRVTCPNGCRHRGRGRGRMYARVSIPVFNAGGVVCPQCGAQMR